GSASVRPNLVLILGASQQTRTREIAVLYTMAKSIGCFGEIGPGICRRRTLGCVKPAIRVVKTGRMLKGIRRGEPISQVVIRVGRIQPRPIGVAPLRYLS